jgi:hypothetical protein
VGKVLLNKLGIIHEYYASNHGLSASFLLSVIINSTHVIWSKLRQPHLKLGFFTVARRGGERSVNYLEGL